MHMRLRFLIFFSVVLSVIVAIHFYIWVRLVRDTGLPMGWRRAASVGVVALAVALISSFFIRRALDPSSARMLMLPVNMWMGTMLLLLLLLASGDLVKLVVKASWWVGSGAQGIHPGRRLFLSRLVGGAATLGAFGTAVLASRSAMGVSRVVTRHIAIQLRQLPAQLDGFRMVQITDLHIGDTLGRAWLEGIVARVNALRPDLIAITGDLVDASVEMLKESIQPLADLRAPQGVFVCTGNHEYYSGAVEWCEYLPALGLRVLRNERVPVSKDGQIAFDIAGVDDFSSTGMAPGHGPNLESALMGRDANRAVVLLAHQPRAVIEAAERGVDLQLSGHTHGGQMWPMHYLVYLQQPYISGLVNHQGTMLYVSQGTGFWGPPMRIGSTAEITEIRLRSTSG